LGGGHFPMTQRNMEQHIKILGILNIIAGAMIAFGGLILLMIFGGIYAVVRSTPSAITAQPVIGIIGLGLAMFLLVLSIPSIIAGIGLLYVKPWARVFAIIVSILHLPHIPFGTALGIYGLWVLFSPEGINCFSLKQQWIQP
jgi:hypothetical protein